MSGPWDDLVTAATLGTDRRPVDLAGWPGAVGELARSVPSTGPALLLDAAALGTAYRRAGATPDPGDVRAAPEAPEPVRPEVPEAAAARLRDLLAVGQHDLLQEWLRLAAAARRRGPADCLPALLDLAVTRRELAADVAAVLDLPGAWLAGFRADWSRAAAAASAELDGPPPDDWWTHGAIAQRVTWLRWLRGTDPAAGRAALELVFAREKATDRAALLAALAHGLGPEDEGVLEGALDDRSDAVRAEAALLLGRLPGSAFVERWRGRVALWVRLDGRRRHRGLEVVGPPPGSPDPATVRDLAVDLTRRNQGVRDRQLAAAPAAAWSSVLGEPSDWVGLPVSGRASGDLLGAWTWAAERDHDLPLARALLEAGQVAASLLRLLPPQERAARAGAAVRAARDVTEALDVLLTCPAPWPPSLAEAAVQPVVRTHADPAARVRSRRLLEVLAHRADVRDPRAGAVLRRLVEELPATSPLLPAAHQALLTLSTREQVHTEMLGTGPAASTTRHDPTGPGDGPSTRGEP